MAKDFRPFEDDAANLTVAGLSIENGRDRISVHGDLDVTADRAGLRRVEQAIAALTEIRDALASRADLAEAVQTVDPDAVTTVANPFGTIKPL